MRQGFVDEDALKNIAEGAGVAAMIYADLVRRAEYRTAGERPDTLCVYVSNELLIGGAVGPPLPSRAGRDAEATAVIVHNPRTVTHAGRPRT